MARRRQNGSIKTTPELGGPLLPSNTGKPRWREGLLTSTFSCVSFCAFLTDVLLLLLLFSQLGEYLCDLQVVEKKMNAFQVLSLTLLSVLAANAQVIKPGRCPKPAVQKNFDAARVKQQQQQRNKQKCSSFSLQHKISSHKS